MQKTIWILLALLFAAVLVYQAGKWSGKQLADTSAANPLPEQGQTLIPVQATLVASAPSNNTMVQGNNTAATGAVLPSLAASSELLSSDLQNNALQNDELAQLVQILDNKPTLHLTERVLSLAPEQLQQAMWQLEQLSTNISTYQRQQQLQQKFNNGELGTLLQLNCSDTLCIAMLQYEDPQSRKAAMPQLSALANSAALQATFLSKAHANQYYNFFMVYGWQ